MDLLSLKKVFFDFIQQSSIVFIHTSQTCFVRFISNYFIYLMLLKMTLLLGRNLQPCTSGIQSENLHFLLLIKRWPGS